MLDEPLEKLLEDLDSAKRRVEQRMPLIQEALDELPHTESVRLENYMGFGRSLRIDDRVREALRDAAEEEAKQLHADVERLRERVMQRRIALDELQSS